MLILILTLNWSQDCAVKKGRMEGRKEGKEEGREGGRQTVESPTYNRKEISGQDLPEPGFLSQAL